MKREGARALKISSTAITGETPMESDPLSVLRDEFYFTITHLKPTLNGFG